MLHDPMIKLCFIISNHINIYFNLLNSISVKMLHYIMMCFVDQVRK